MAYVSKLSRDAWGAIAGVPIQEGRLITLVASGLRNDLPTALIAASGLVRNVYVAMVPPDNFARPTPGFMYTAGNLGTFYETNGYTDFAETNTWYHAGLSTFENPMIASGMFVQAHTDVTVTVPSGCVVPNAALKVTGAKAKVASDGTGRFEFAPFESESIARVVEYDPSTDLYIFEVNS